MYVTLTSSWQETDLQPTDDQQILRLVEEVLCIHAATRTHTPEHAHTKWGCLFNINAEGRTTGLTQTYTEWWEPHEPVI